MDSLLILFTTLAEEVHSLLRPREFSEEFRRLDSGDPCIGFIREPLRIALNYDSHEEAIMLLYAEGRTAKAPMVSDDGMMRSVLVPDWKTLAEKYCTAWSISDSDYARIRPFVLNALDEFLRLKT